MVTLLSALVGFALLDSLDVLLVGITAAVAHDARLRRISPLRNGLSFIAGVFVATTTFGIITVFGIDFLTGMFAFELIPIVRYWGELIVGVVLLVLALLPASSRPPPTWTNQVRSSSFLLAVIGFSIGIVQAPTAVPYLAGLAMLSSYAPLPAFWPVMIVVYCMLALLPPVFVLTMSTGRTQSARRRYRTVVRALMKLGPLAVRLVFAVVGAVLVVDALRNGRHLW